MEFESIEQYKSLFETNQHLFIIGKQYGDTIYIPLYGFHIGKMRDGSNADGHIERLLKQDSGQYIKTYAKKYVLVNNEGKIDRVVTMDENYTWIVKKTNKFIYVEL